MFYMNTTIINTNIPKTSLVEKSKISKMEMDSNQNTIKEKIKNTLSVVENLIDAYYTRKDLSFKAWLKDNNQFSQKEIIKSYEEAKNAVKRDIQSENAKLNIFSKNKDKQNIETTKAKISTLNLVLTKLTSFQKEDIEILKRENKKIKNWKNFETLFYQVEEAIDILKVDLKRSKQAINGNQNFLSKFRKLVNRNNTDIICKSDLDKETKNLSKDSTDFFNKNNLKISDYLPPNLNTARKVLSKIGKKIEKDPREDLSDTINGIDFSNMFEGIDQRMKLTQIVMLQAHDTGSYTMAPLSSTDIYGKGSQTQSGNITSMLKSGARCFDIRVRLVKSIPLFHHGSVTGGSFLEGAKQISKFLKTNRNELIVIELKCDDDCVKKIREMSLMKDFLDLVYYPPDEKKAPEITIGEMIKSNKRILILRQEGEIKGFCFSHEDTINHWNGIDQFSEDPAVRLNYEQKFLEENKGKNKFLFSSEIRTPTKKNYINIPVRKIVKNNKILTYSPMEEARQNKTSEDEFFQLESVKKFANIIGIDDIRNKSNKAKIVKEWNQARSEAFKRLQKKS